MALTDQLTAITQKKIQAKLFDNIFDSNGLLKKLLASGQYTSEDGGTAITVPLNYAATTSSGWYSGADTLQTSDNQNLTSASFDWKSIYANVSISEEDRLKNSGKLGILKILKSKVMIAEKTLKDDVGTGLFSDGTDAKSIVGLRDIVATDQTVGGISQTANTWWAGQVDSTTTTLTISAMQTQYENAAIDEEKPNVLVGTRANYNRYYALLQPQQRFSDDGMAKGGFSNLLFNSAPFFSDSHCPTNHLFFLNMNHLWMWYHPERNFTAMPFTKPLNQEVIVGRFLWMGAFGSSNNRLHAKMSALTA